MSVQKPIKRRVRKKLCYFTSNKIEALDYKDIKTLNRFITDHGENCSKTKFRINCKMATKSSQCHKKSRFMGLIPYTIDR